MKPPKPTQRGFKPEQKPNQPEPAKRDWPLIAVNSVIGLLALLAATAITISLARCFGAGDLCNPKNYRIRTDGSAFKVDYRKWPYWVESAETQVCLHDAERSIADMVKAHRAKRDYVAPTWITVTPNLRPSFTNCAECRRWSMAVTIEQGSPYAYEATNQVIRWYFATNLITTP